MNPAMEIYEQIGQDIQKFQAEIDDLKVMVAFGDAKDVAPLRALMNSRRDFIDGLERARSIAYRQAMSIKESA